MRTLALLVALVGLLPACRDTWQEREWQGRTDAQLTRELGAPSASHVFTLGHDANLYEYQSALHRFAPDAGTDALEVKELVWEGRLSTRIAWLRRDAQGRWVVVDTLGYRAGVVF